MHASRWEAEALQEEMGDERLRPYFCLRCKAWHLGHEGPGTSRMSMINRLIDQAMGKGRT